MVSTTASIAYLKQGFQWIAGIFIYTNVVSLLTKVSWLDFVLLNTLVLLPVLWQVIGLRLRKAGYFFDILTLVTYVFLLIHGLPTLVIAGFSYTWMIFAFNVYIVSWYFIRLRWFLFR